MTTQTAAPAVNTKLITGDVRFSYLTVFEPKVGKSGGDPKYSVSLLIPKTDTATVKAIQDVVEALKAQAITKFGKLTKNFKFPLKDGDDEEDNKFGDDAYAGHYYINASSKQKPGVIDRAGRKLNPDELKSGDYGRASLNFFIFDADGNKGISAGLNNILKLRDGEALSGKPDATSEFAEFLEVGEDDAKDLLG